MTEPVPVRDAATVVVLRDGAEGLEVLLCERNSSHVFAPSAHVFPGGAVDDGDGDFRDTAAREAKEEVGLVLDPAELRELSRWITPPGSPRRFDTRFFVAAAPDGCDPVCDGEEIVSCRWWRPTEALAAGLELIEPTRVTLEWLTRHPTTQAALESAPA